MIFYYNMYFNIFVRVKCLNDREWNFKNFMINVIVFILRWSKVD